jgi:DNA-binding NarL/FixJ family response regulator/biotin operon repressor
MLEELGIDPDVEIVYRALLGRPSTSVGSLAAALKLTSAQVEKAVADLLAAGLAVRADDETYVAAPPAVALGALITERRDGLRLAEQALVSLAEEHRAAVAGRKVSDAIEVVSGVEAIQHRFRQVQHAATRELRLFVTVPFVAVPMGENTAETAAADRGIRIRAVIEQAVLAEPGAIEESIDSIRGGMELRVAEKLPMKLVLADDDLALVPLAAGAAEDEPGAVLLQRSGLLAALDALFEAVWSRSYPLELSRLERGEPVGETDESDGPTDLDRQILTLMLAGLTDQAVATQLDLSLRTVQRRLRHLQDLAGVKSRMQLGWYAGRHGWA